MPRTKDGAHVINLDDKYSKVTHWFSSFINKSIAIYFDSFGIEYIPPEVLNIIKNKSISHTHYILRIRDNESIMPIFYCIAFIQYIVAEKTFLDYTDLFSPNDYKRNDKIISILKANIVEEAILEFRLRKIDKAKNYLLNEIKHNDLISKKYKKTRKCLNYVENLLILAAVVTGCVLISAFDSLVDIPVRIISSAVGVNICAITSA